MGWTTHFGASKDDIIKDRISDKKYCLNFLNDMTLDPNRRGTALAHRCIGNELYIVWSMQKRNNETEEFTEVDRFIEVDLIQKFKEGYGYKDMDESMMPYYFKCPLSFLDMVPEDKYPDSVNLKWREAVRDVAAKVAARPKYGEGDTLVFDPPIKAQQLTITEATCIEKKGHIFNVKGLGRARMPVSMINKHSYTVHSTS